MTDKDYSDIFNKEVCATLLPPEKSNDFFEALFGDASEGAYDIELAYAGATESTLQFDLLLHERPGRCLACNLTQGLPQVFSRHPVINIAGIVDKITKIIDNGNNGASWSLGHTQQPSRSLHSIPLQINLK